MAGTTNPRAGREHNEEKKGDSLTMKILPAALAALALAFSILLPTDSLAAKQCGSSGKRVCAWYEQVPVCDLNLNIKNGKCVHPDCGKHDERACTAKERLAQPCDWGLVPEPTKGICLKPKEILSPEAMKRKAQTEYCKSVLTAISSNNLPPELSVVIAPLRNAANDVSQRAAQLGQQARDYAKRNQGAYNQLAPISKALRRDAARFARLRQLFTPDEFCANRTYNERVNQMTALGLWPSVPIQLLARQEGAPRMFQAASGEERHHMLAIGLEYDWNPVLEGKAAVAFLWDISAGKVGPVVNLSAGVKSNLAVQLHAFVKWQYMQVSEIARGLEGHLEGGFEIDVECVGGGAYVEFPFDGQHFDGVGVGGGGGIGCLPIAIGGGADWHWVLLPSSGLGEYGMGGTL
jgi:hypothetical protein